MANKYLTVAVRAEWFNMLNGPRWKPPTYQYILEWRNMLCGMYGNRRQLLRWHLNSQVREAAQDVTFRDALHGMAKRRYVEAKADPYRHSYRPTAGRRR